MTAQDLVRLGVCDEIVGESSGGAHRDPAATADKLRAALVRHLKELSALDHDELLERRYAKFRAIGAYTEAAAGFR